MTSTIIMLAEVIPSVSPDDVAWKYSLPMIGFLIMQACRKKGMKEISRHNKSRDLWDAFKRERNNS